MMIYHLSRCNLIYTELWEGENFLTVSFWSHRQLISIYIYSTGPHLRIWFRKKVMISNLSKFQGNCAIIMLTIIPPVTHHILLAPCTITQPINKPRGEQGRCIFFFFFGPFRAFFSCSVACVCSFWLPLFAWGESRDCHILHAHRLLLVGQVAAWLIN